MQAKGVGNCSDALNWCCSAVPDRLHKVELVADDTARGLGVTVDALLSDNGDAAPAQPAKRKRG